jgi:hypothetical protein
MFSVSQDNSWLIEDILNVISAEYRIILWHDVDEV